VNVVDKNESGEIEFLMKMFIVICCSMYYYALEEIISSYFSQDNLRLEKFDTLFSLLFQKSFSFCYFQSQMNEYEVSLHVTWYFCTLWLFELIVSDHRMFCCWLFFF
jgi:hypothetical protein